MANATLNRAAIVAQFTASVVDVATYVSACGAIDGLVTAGQVTSSDASGAKADLAAVLATAIASAAKSGGKNTITIVARRLDKSFENREKGAAKGSTVPGKGNVCVYGVQRNPVCLYPAQWERLLEQADAIRKCIADNKASLSWK